MEGERREKVKNGVLVALGVAVWAALKGVAKIIKVLITVLTNVIIFFGLYIPLFYGLFGVLLLALTDFTLGGTGTNQILYYIGLGLCFFASVIITVRTVFVRPISAIFEPLINLIRDFRDRKAARRAEKEGYDEDLDPSDEYAPDRRDRYRDEDPYEREPLRYARGREYPAYEDRYAGYAPRDAYAPAPSRDPYAAPRDEYDSMRDVYRQTAPQDDYYRDVPAYGEQRDPARTTYEPAPEADRRGYPDDRAPYDRAPYGESRYPRFGIRPPREPEAERPLIYYSRRRPGILVEEYSDRFDLYREDVNGRVFVGREYKGE